MSDLSYDRQTIKYEKLNCKCDENASEEEFGTLNLGQRFEKKNWFRRRTKEKDLRFTAMAASTSATNVIPNVQGLEDKKSYKFRSVGDNNVIRLESAGGNKLICMPQNKDDDDLEKFRALRLGNGKYRILPKIQKSPEVCQVWDYLPHRELLILRKESAADKFTQHWSSEHVTGFNSLYLIQSGPSLDSEKCLKNMGAGKQIEIVSKSEDSIGDNFLRWYLDLQDE